MGFVVRVYGDCSWLIYISFEFMFREEGRKRKFKIENVGVWFVKLCFRCERRKK